MTQVGKGIVLFNLFLSFAFVGMATLMVSTKVDLKEAESQASSRKTAASAAQGELTKKKTAVTDELGVVGVLVDAAKKRNADTTKKAASRQQELEADLKRVRNDIADVVGKIKEAQGNLQQNREGVRKNEASLESLKNKIADQEQNKAETDNRLRQRTNELETLKSRAEELARRLKELENSSGKSAN